MDHEKRSLNDVENSSNEKVPPPHQLENGMENVHLEKDAGGYSIPDPDAHLSPEEKAAVVSNSQQ